MDSVSLRPFTADDRDWLLDRHAEIYWQEHGFDARFAVAVAGCVDEMAMRAFRSPPERLLRA